METYPYPSSEGIIELVRKSEYDALFQSLCEAEELIREIRDNEVNAQDEAGKFLRDHQPSELSKLRAELTRWQALARQLAEALKACKNRAMDKSIETHADDHAKGCIDDIWEWSENALAAYESAKHVNEADFVNIDPLAEAVKRMESVSLDEMCNGFAAMDLSGATLGEMIEAVRDRLIQAATATTGKPETAQ